MLWHWKHIYKSVNQILYDFKNKIDFWQKVVFITPRWVVALSCTRSAIPGNMTAVLSCPFPPRRSHIHLGMETITGMHALQWAREISKLPDGCFTIAFYPYSRARGQASAKLVTKAGCKYRAQLPQERFQVDSDNLFLFVDADGKPKSCYRILIRYMGFPQDGFKLHKIDWLWISWICGVT